MENINRFMPEMTIGLIWFFGGLILGWAGLAWAMAPEWALRSKKPECAIYKWTINTIILHILVGLVIGCYQYSQWYYSRKPMDTFYSSWPLILFYLACIGVDCFLIFRFFLPSYRKYSEKSVLKKLAPLKSAQP